MKIKGFTLVELMIVVAIVSILASIAVPAYNNYVLRGKLTEAITELAGMRVKLEQHYQDYKNYGTGTCGVAVPVSPAVKYFSYTCVLPTDQSFTVSATGIAAQGTGNFIYTIDQDNNKTTEISGTLTNCWARKEDGSC